MTVYFIREKRPNGCIKIGFADNNVLARLLALQTGIQNVLEIAGLILGADRGVERELHCQFSRARVRGEWFRPAPDLLDYISIHATRPPAYVTSSVSREGRAYVSVKASGIEKMFTKRNWLGMVTYDVFKYAKFGGRVSVTPTDEGLAITLLGVFADSDGINKKFRALLESMTEEKVQLP